MSDDRDEQARRAREEELFARYEHRLDPDYAAELRGERPAVEKPPDPKRTPGASRYGWIAAVAGLLIIVYILVNTLRTTGPGSRGPRSGTHLLEFAAPLAASNLVGDSNVFQRPVSGKPPPACREKPDPRAFNACRAVRERPLVLAFFVAGQKECETPLDAMEHLQKRFPHVGFAAVSIKGDRDQIRKEITDHGWTFPVAYDPDGAVSTINGISICPSVVLVRKGGRVMRTALGDTETTEAALAAAVRRLGS